MEVSTIRVTADGEAQLINIPQISTYGNIWVREVVLNKGERKVGHKHEFDHLHFLTSGKAIITVFDADKKSVILSREYTSPAWIKVPKNHFHDIESLEDGTVGYCIQALRNDSEEVIATDYISDKDFIDEVKAYEEAKGIQDEDL